MVNHVQTTPRITTVMYLTKDKKYVIVETTIRDTRPVKYFTQQLLKGIREK